jgi:hypothetical protein
MEFDIDFYLIDFLTLRELNIPRDEGLQSSKVWFTSGCDDFDFKQRFFFSTFSLI